MAATGDMTEAAPAPPAARSWRGFGLSASAIGLLVVIDQLLLPMFHFGNFPFKPTYLLVGLWAVDQMVRNPVTAMNGWQARHFRDVSLMFGLIAACALLGTLYFNALYGASDLGLTVKNLTMLLLAAMSFGVGITATRFRMSWLVGVLAAALAINLLFIVLRSAMPAWIVNLYFPPLAVENLSKLGVKSASDILELSRPRGMTSNPNGSAFMVNIIVLFIYCGLRFRFIPLPGVVVGAMLVFMPMALSMVLASRGEFLSAAILGFLNLRLLLNGASAQWRLRMFVVCILLGCAGIYGVARIGLGDSLLANLQRIASIMRVLNERQAAVEGDVQTDTVVRPLLTAKEMSVRFVISPLFGSGYASTSGPPFDQGTEYFHNDWFWLVVTSGLVGVAAMLWFVLRYCVPITPVLVLPFVLPGMVNTFMLNIPVMMFFFFMMGVLLVKLHLRELERLRPD